MIDEDLMYFMEGHDNDNLPDGAWQGVLEDAVHIFNTKYNTTYDSHDSFMQYIEWKTQKDEENGS